MTEQDRRAVLRGACAVLIGVACLRVGPWAARSVETASQRRAARAAILVQARSLVEAAPGLRDSLAASLRAFLGLTPRLVPGRTLAEASSNLASDIRTLAAQSSLRLLQMTPETDSVRGLVRMVSLRAELEGDVMGLSGFVRGVETGQRLLTFESLSVSAPDPVPHSDAPETLHIEVHVSGWYLPVVQQ